MPVFLQLNCRNSKPMMMLWGGEYYKPEGTKAEPCSEILQAATASILGC